MTKKLQMVVPCLSIFVLLLCSCSGKQPSVTPTIMPNSLPSSASSELFLETESTSAVTSGPHIARSRFVKVNFALLLDDAKQSSRLKTNSEIMLNLFPDVTYIGVIDHIEENGFDYSWSGHLKDVEFSELTIVYTGETFIAHFASPGGVYEVSNVGEDLYQVVLIDQTKLPSGEG